MYSPLNMLSILMFDRSSHLLKDQHWHRNNFKISFKYSFFMMRTQNFLDARFSQNSNRKSFFKILDLGLMAFNSAEYSSKWILKYFKSTRTNWKISYAALSYTFFLLLLSFIAQSASVINQVELVCIFSLCHSLFKLVHYNAKISFYQKFDR